MSSNDENFKFDPNLFIKLANLNEEIERDGEFKATELSFDVDEAELLRELEALSPSGSSKPQMNSVNSTVPLMKPANFSMIRTDGDVINDFNVENMVLTPEDENNPELLAELSSLMISEDAANDKGVAVTLEPETKSDKSEDQVSILKKEILRLKREGDMEGAKLKLKELNDLERSSKTNSNSVVESETKLPIPTFTQVPLVNSNTNTIPSVPTSPKLQASDAQVYRDLFTKLQRQSAAAQTISEFYAAANRKSDANLFIKRKQALDLEIQKLRLMLKGKQPAPPSRIVNVTYEYVLNNPEIPEGQLQVTLGQLKVILPRKFKLKPEEEYKIKIFYELPGLNEKEMNLISEPFTTQGLSKNSLSPFLFKCNKKDLRVVKSVEYKKLRLEIVGQSGFLFFKSDVTKSTGQCKLDKLLKDCTMREEIDLFDVEEGKKSALPSAQINLTAKLRSPLTSDGFKQNTEKWTVIPSFGYSNHTLYSDLSPPASPAVLKPSESQSSGTLADHIKSFEVIEYELGLLAQNQAAVFADNNLMDLQVALEALRDRIQLQVELGQISLEDYLNSVKECINDAKRLALESKRSGDLQLAQKYVKHVDIMRKEVAEAEASMAAEREEND